MFTAKTMNFANKVVLVTGASSGIGKATAILFAARGARLVLVDRDEQNLREVANACAKQKGLRPLSIIADLSTDEGCERTAKETLAHYGRLDVLINNAAVGARMNLEKADMETFDRVFNTDVRGVYNLTRLLAPALIETKGNIVNTSSISGTMVTVGTLPYGMAKAAIDHFMRLIALELAPKGVRVNNVSPGVTVSNMLKSVTGISDEQYKDFLDEIAGAIPMKRVCQPEHIAKTIAFLASDESEMTTGNIVKVDGGAELGMDDSFVSNQIKK